MIELVLRAPQALVEEVSDALVDHWGALAVTVEDADAGTLSEQALFGEPGMPAPAAGWSRCTVRALFEDEAQAEAAAAAALAADPLGLGSSGAKAGQADAVQSQPSQSPIAIQALQVVPDQDWVRLTQSQFAPVPIAPGFWVVPSWHEPPPGAHTVIRLDPGLAFGTGTHPTTRMCLRWLAQHPRAQGWQRVLDYGCGSGILAIAAAKLGAKAVLALDIDPAAVASTQANAAANRVQLQAGLPEALPPHTREPGHAATAGSFDLVLANILASPLTLLAPLLCQQVALGGQLIMAGILARQAQQLQAAYAPWLAIDVLDEEDGWILMGGQRPGHLSGGQRPGHLSGGQRLGQA